MTTPAYMTLMRANREDHAHRETSRILADHYGNVARDLEAGRASIRYARDDVRDGPDAETAAFLRQLDQADEILTRALKHAVAQAWRHEHD